MHNSNRIFTTLFAVLVVGMLLPMFSFAQNPRTITEESIAAMSRYKSLSGKLVRKERFKGKMLPGELDFKMTKSPRQVYIKNYIPDEGAEVIYLKGKNNGEALVNPNKPLMPNLNLNPEGDLLMKEQHHSMLNLGMDFTHNVIKHSLDKYGDKFDEFVSYKGELNWHGRKVHVIEIKFSDWAWESYSVTKSETLLELERRLNLNANLIAEKNNLNINAKLKPGKTIQVPNAYAKTTTLFVDKTTKMPVMQEMADEKGVFERYDYQNLKVNPSFPANTFSEDNPDYGF